MKALKLTCFILMSIPMIAAAKSPFKPVGDISGEVKSYERTLSNQTHDLEIALDETTVRCLVGDYGASSLKISVPELRDLTVFDHTTAGETEPCINAGMCATKFNGNRGLTPRMILRFEEPTEEVSMTVVLTETLTINVVHKDCYKRLSEKVNSKVRGLQFAHEDGEQSVEVDYQTCRYQVGLGDDKSAN